MAETVKLPYVHIVTHIQNLFHSEDTKDITFLFEGSDRILRAHKFLLEVASVNVFKRMFNGHFKEKDTAVIRQIRPEIFEMLIYAIYLKDIKITCMEDAIDLYNAAEMYDMADLKIQAVFYMNNDVYWHNAIFLYDKVGVFNLDSVRKSCCKVFERYHYQTLISHLFRGEEITEDVFIEVAKQWKGEHNELYHILEVYVELGILKTYNRAIGTISFLADGIEQALTAKLLSDEEKCAIIANIQSDESRFETFIEMPGNLSSKRFVYHKNSETTDFSHLIWTTLLIACRSKKNYLEFLLKKCMTLGGGFMDSEVFQKVFEPVSKGDQMKRTDFEYLFEGLKKYINIFEKYEARYDGDMRVRLIERQKFKDIQVELFSYEF